MNYQDSFIASNMYYMYMCIPVSCVHGMSLGAWHICITISSSVHWRWRTTRGQRCVYDCGSCWVEKTLFWLAVLISCRADKDSLWAWHTLVGPLLTSNDSSKWQSNLRSSLSAYLHCCPQLLTSTATSQIHKLHWFWSSHVSHSKLTFHQPLWMAVLTTMATCIETNCPLPLPFILLFASLAANPVPMAMQKVFILCTGCKPQRHISTCISKMNGI